MKDLKKAEILIPSCGIVAMLAVVLTGCHVIGHGYHEQSRTMDNKYLDSREPSDLNTGGIESSDLQAACQTMVGKLVADSRLTSGPYPPALIVEPEYFSNDAEAEFNPKVLADLVRNELLNAADGRVRVFRAGDTSQHIDYALGAHVTRVRQLAGTRAESYIQIAFEVVDMTSKQVLFSDLYNFKKASSVPTL